MIQFKRNSFLTGFLVACLLWISGLIITDFHFLGGRVGDSPSGKYHLSITAPLEETTGGTYEIELINNATGQTLRSMSIQLSTEEKTISLRGQPVSFEWDEEETSVGIILDGEFLTRLSVPAK
ncbi:MAG: hypothetical protein HUJ26_22155 [Planctomycetaceae bacterium]|nr:hypothetical protein [Planctomycetaceae bacterium]